MTLRNSFSIVAAMLRCNRGIGFKNTLPWPRIPEDMNYFSKLTTNNNNNIIKINSVIMGRKTWESLPKIAKPLRSRINIVVSRNPEFKKSISKNIFDPFVYVTSSLDDALKLSYSKPWIGNTFVIGGEQIFNEAIERTDCSKIYLTQIDMHNSNIECDKFFPKIPRWMKLDKTKQIRKENYTLDFEKYVNIFDPFSNEMQYLMLLKEIIDKGELKYGRNGGVKSIFGSQHIFDLKDGFPLLTTKRMFFDGIVKELLFFLKGHTDSKILSSDGVKIWDENTTREFLDSRGLTDYNTGDMGPMYGYNWRSFGYPYEGCDKDYSGKGYDQLWHLINSLINDKNSRRHLLTTYDPSTVDQSVLAPCHGLIIQFNVTNNNELDCKMYQRSVDTALGYPFNIASYALLVHLLCHITGYKPGKLIMTLGDTHLYKQHIREIKKQLDRIPLIKPTLSINAHFDSNITSIDEKISFLETIEPDNIRLNNYHYWPGIKMDMIA